MGRFYVPKEAVKDDEILVTGEEAHHILDVMRFKKSDRISAFDGSGNEYIGIIKGTSRKSVLIGITETRKSFKKGALNITLMQAIPKGKRMDYIVEKSSELGVSVIMPVIANRTIPIWNESKKHSSMERWRKIAEGASKQCGRLDIPRVGQINNFDMAIKNSDQEGIKLIAALNDKAIPLKKALSDVKGTNIVVAIGPEGDFTEDEIRLARQERFALVDLGPRVLRSDTAALAVLAILNYELTG